MVRKMNLLWIVMDHVTFRHYRMTKGARPVLGTFERLGAEGVEFTGCRSVHPLCLPARASMLTGVYAHKHRKTRNGRGFPDAGYPLLMDYLGEKGYAVGYFGKNHSGFEDFESRGISGFFPDDYGNPYLTPEYGKYLKDHRLSNPIYRQEWHIRNMGFCEEDREYDLTRENNFNSYSAGYLSSPGRVHESDFVASIAADWIRGAVREGKPFAVGVNTWGPHHAYQVPLEYRNLIDETEIEEYPGYDRIPEDVCNFSSEFVRKIRANNECRSWEQFRHIVKRAYEQYSYVDAAIGRLLDELKSIGVYDDTAVVLTADHGDSLGSHGGMVDKCGDMTEELMHVPLVVKLPSVPGGKKCSALVTNMDVMPTLLQMAGCDVPEYIDGKSLVPLLRDPGGDLREDLMCQHYGHFDVHKVQRAVYFGRYKYVAVEDDRELLYDLEKDPFEFCNLAGDGRHKAELSEMRRRLKGNLLKYGDTFETQSLLK